MLPEYLKYWGLKKPPFSLTPDPQMLYMSRQHQEGLVRLKFAVVSNKGGALLVSENAGDGKTSLLARLRVELAEQYHGNCRTVFIDHPTLTANQMVSEIARQIGLGAGTTDKLALLNELRAFLLACHEKGENCVVMLDEGQMLCHRPDILQELRILLNFCISDSFLLTFILSGQKPLDEAIRAMPEFYQRLPVRFFLRNLGRDDTRELIRYRLHKAGNPPGREIFSEDGYTGIYNFSKGCPRVICSVADLALVIAHSNFSDQVDFVSVSQACSDMNRTDGAYHYYHFLKSFSSPQSVPSDPTAGAPGGTYCANCGAARPDGSKFCPDCGHPVEATERPSAAEPPVSEPSAADQVREEMQADPSSVDVVAEVELPPEAPPAGEATGYLSETPSNGEDPLLAETAAEDQPYEDMETAPVSGEQALDSDLPPEAPPAGETGDSPLEAQSGAEEPLPAEPASEIPAGKHCSNCGTELVEFAKFCFACGHPAAVQELETGLPPDIEELAAESAGEAAAGVEEAAANSTGEKAETGPAERKKPPAGETAGTEPSVGPEQEKISEPEAALPANPRSGSQLGRLLRFVLEGEENLGEAVTDKNENSAEPVAESDNLKMDPEPEPLPAAAQVEEPPVVADPVDTRIELESAAESGEASLQAEEPPAPELKKTTTVKCSFCGLDLPLATLECPNCGENLVRQEDTGEELTTIGRGSAAGNADESREPGLVAEEADVRRLLDRVIELSLGRYLAAGKSAGDGHYILKPGEELLRFPLKRFFGASAVLQFAAAAGAESFSARCGVAFTASSLRIQLRREFRELPYHGLVSVNVDQLRDNGTPLLSRLALASGSGVYRISLPLGAEVGLALCEALRTFLESRMAGAGLTGSSQSAAEPGEVDAGGHD